mgnify:CR=1 FL=1
MSRLDEVDALLREEGYVSGPEEEVKEVDERSDGDDTGRDEEEASEEEVEERYTVKDLASKLETTPAKLYAAMDIKLSDGSTMTLSELKDLAVKGKSIDTHTEKRDKDYNELMVQRKEINDVFEKLSTEGKLTEDTINKIRESNDKRIASEMKLLMKALPDWENQSIRNKEINQIAEYSRQYGISQQELDALVTDHRLMKLIRDAATKPMNKPKEIAPSGRSHKVNTKVDTTTTAGKINAISALLN